MSKCAKKTLNSINELSLRTIDDVERLLLSLPESGTKSSIEVIKRVAKRDGKSTADVVAKNGSLKIRDVPKPLSLSPPTSSSSQITTVSSPNTSQQRKKVEYKSISSIHRKLEAPNGSSNEDIDCTEISKIPVMSNKVRVSPMTSIAGVVLDLDVEVTMPDGGEKKIIKIEIECPNFVPDRIKIDGKWKKIV